MGAPAGARPNMRGIRRSGAKCGAARQDCARGTNEGTLGEPASRSFAGPLRSRRNMRDGCDGAKILARLHSDRRGASAILFGLAMPVLVGFLGLGVEVSYWYLEKRKLQEAADSSALAGAREYAANNAGQAQMEAAAAVAAGKSGFAGATLALSQPPTSGPFAIGGTLEDPAAVEVVLTETYGTHFVSLLGMTTATIRARAVAAEGGGDADSAACILSLAEDEPEICDNNSTGIVFQGSLDLETSECLVHSNDSCGPSFDFNGNPDVEVDCLTYSGGSDPAQDPISGDSSGLVLGACDAPGYHEPVADPYENASIPGDLGPCHGSPAGLPDPDDPADPDLRRFTPGYYCDNDPNPNVGGMELLSQSGQVNTLDPGIYFIEGDVGINGGSIIGQDVTLVFVDGNFDFNGNGDLILVAPDADDIYDTGLAPGFDLVQDQGIAPYHYWDGLAVYIAEASSLGDGNPCANKINGTATVQVSGTVYAPDTCITFTGNNSAGGADDPCFRLVGGNISLAGNVAMTSSNCAMPGGAGEGGPGSLGYGMIVGLVE